MDYEKMESLANSIPNKGIEPTMGLLGIRIHFDNEYGVSIVSHEYSYGGRGGLYELAVLRGDDLCYDTPIADDVIGWLTAEEAIEIARKVEAL